MPLTFPTYLLRLVNVVKVRPLIKKNQHLTTSTAPHSDALAYFLFPVKKTKRSHSLQQLSRRRMKPPRRRRHWQETTKRHKTFSMRQNPLHKERQSCRDGRITCNIIRIPQR